MRNRNIGNWIDLKCDLSDHDFFFEFLNPLNKDSAKTAYLLPCTLDQDFLRASTWGIRPMDGYECLPCCFQVTSR